MTDKTSPEYLAYKGEAGVRVVSELLADRIIGWTEGYADGCLPETWDSTDATWTGLMDEVRELKAELDQCLTVHAETSNQLSRAEERIKDLESRQTKLND